MREYRRRTCLPLAVLPALPALAFGAVLVSFLWLSAPAEAALPPPPGIPCAARAAAVIANTGSVFSNPGSLVDSYQSSRGSYGGANVGADAKVQAAATLVANGGVIHGPVTQGAPAGLAAVPVPAGAINLPLGAHTPGSLNINNTAQSVTLAPGTYVAASVNVNFPGAITVSPAGPVLIWVTGSLNLGGNENATGIPDNLQFLVSGTTAVSVNAGGKLAGFIYAPAAVVNLGSTVLGGVVGSSVSLNSGSTVHFDDSSVCPVPKTILSAGDEGTNCALTSAGGVTCWGQDTDGIIGANGASLPNCIDNAPCALSPVPVAGLAGGVTKVATGGVSACAITAGGGLVCWGVNADGVLGNGSGPVTTLTPTPVTGLSSGVLDVAVADLAACAVTASGGVMCWGDDSTGVLGPNAPLSADCGPQVSCSTVPVPITGFTGAVASVALGAGLTASNMNGGGALVSTEACALTVGGGVNCWGRNDSGQLGNNGVSPDTCGILPCSRTPVQVTGLASGVTSLSLGSDFACAVNAAGGVVCWGGNESGQLGNGSFVGSPVPVPVAGLGSGVVKVSAGFGSACALTAGGSVECWGLNDFGQLGNGVLPGPECFSQVGGACTSVTPVQVTGLAGGVSGLSVGKMSACAVTVTGAVVCWGLNEVGELGNNQAAAQLCGGSPNGELCSTVPVAVIGLP